MGSRGKGHDQRCPCRLTCHQRRAEEEWRVHYSWPCQDQDSQETSNQGHQEDHVWQRNDRQSKACQNCRQGIPSCCVEGKHLILDSTRPKMSHTVGRFYSCDMLAWWGFGGKRHCI